jgi:hypothetical protein
VSGSDATTVTVSVSDAETATVTVTVSETVSETETVSAATLTRSGTVGLARSSETTAVLGPIKDDASRRRLRKAYAGCFAILDRPSARRARGGSSQRG